MGPGDQQAARRWRMERRGTRWQHKKAGGRFKGVSSKEEREREDTRSDTKQREGEGPIRRMKRRLARWKECRRTSAGGQPCARGFSLASRRLSPALAVFAFAVYKREYPVPLTACFKPSSPFLRCRRLLLLSSHRRRRRRSLSVPCSLANGRAHARDCGGC